MTRSEVAKLVGVLMAAFPSSKVTAQTSQVYEEFLQDLDYTAANAAVRRLIGTARFMPSIGEIREAVVEVGNGQRRPGGDAWGDVLAAVRKFGVYRTPSFDDPVVARVVQSLGWEVICNSENQAADRARFIETYDKLAGAQRREAQVSAGAKMPELAPRGQSKSMGELVKLALAGAGGEEP